MRKLYLLLALAIPSLAHAELDRVRVQLGSEVQLELLHGYPSSPRALGSPLTFGLELTSSGAERELRVAVSGAASFEQTLRVPARDKRRWFAYLPLRQGSYGYCSLEVTDLATGASKVIEIEPGAYDAMQLARLGPLSSAMNVDKPFMMVGALDAYMPDDWRGLAGLRVIVMEHAYAVSQPPNWRVLLDWVAAGGILVLSTPLPALTEPLPIPLPLPLASKIEEQPAGLVQRVGSGLIARVYPQQLEDVGSELLARLGTCSDCGWTLDTGRGFDTTRTASNRLASAVRPPGWGILGVLVSFALVAGPVGYTRLVLRRRRPLAYLGLAFAASLVFSVLVLAVDLIRNGIHARFIPHSVIVVDQRIDLEIGVEEIAAHVPFGAGLVLHERPGLQLLLPEHQGDHSLDALDVRVAAHGVTVDRAVPVRSRRLIGSRWIGRAQGKLIVHTEPGGLAVENHIGRDLTNIVLWHDGAEYGLRSLRRGARASMTPALQSAAVSGSSGLTRPFTAAATELLDRVARGEMGEHRYLAEIGWDAASSGVLDPALAPFRPGRHVIAGVYR